VSEGQVRSVDVSRHDRKISRIRIESYNREEFFRALLKEMDRIEENGGVVWSGRVERDNLWRWGADLYALW
jgi:phage repressor protein C with HTH and peptisase S24 domain